MTAERYIAVFTGLLSIKRPGEYLYLTTSEDRPGSEDGYTLHRGRPPCGHLGREIAFQDLPERCQRLVLDAYRELWGLQGYDLDHRGHIAQSILDVGDHNGRQPR